jgi:3-phenylpropionate/cinnamic acid dioxygenase small subunit
VDPAHEHRSGRRGVTPVTARPAPLTRQEAEAFLFKEARLLDERRLEEWLELFTADGIFWIPIEDDADPGTQPSILFDDTMLRAQRVYQLLHTSHYCQMPPSRTIHMLSNIEVEEGAGPDEAIVRCNLVVFELRTGDHRQNGLGEYRSFAGRCEYRLRRDGEWRIALRKVLLIDRDLPIYNLSFVL